MLSSDIETFVNETIEKDRHRSGQKIYNLTDHWFPDKIGGSCLYAFKLHKLLAPRVNTETITLIGQPSSDEENMVVHKVLHKARILKNRQTIRDLASDTKAIWVVHSPWIFLHLFFALGFKVRKQVVGVYHGPWFREYYISASARQNLFARLLFSLMRYVIEVFYAMYVKRFIFLSEKMYRSTSQYLPISRSKVHIIPMWSEKIGWGRPGPTHKQVVLSTFRRLEPRMGLQDLLLALKRCDLERYRLDICGDGPFRRELLKLVEQLDLQHRVRLLGWVSEKEKLERIQQSDAVIIPSRCLEGFSLLALESLESGTPLLLTDAVGFYEYVRDMDQDFVQNIDLKAPSVKIQGFLSRAGRNGLDRIESIFAADKIGRALMSVMLPDRNLAFDGKR